MTPETLPAKTEPGALESTMNRSEQIQELTSALATAQGVIEGASKDSSNPFFKSSYADLASVWDAIRKPLSDNGLSVMQLPSADGARVTVTTILAHKSGQFISSELTMTAKEDAPQAIGSAITYARRYALQSIAGVAPEDDDGERAQGRHTPTQKREPERQLVDDLGKTIELAFQNQLKKFIAAGIPQTFKQVLGGYGYTEISEIPVDRDVAGKIMNDLKQAYADHATTKK